MSKEILVTQVRSLIGRPAKHRRTIRALGLTKINSSRMHKDCPVIRGMIHQVKHLIKVEEKS